MKNKKIKILSFLTLLSVGALLTPTIVSCSSVPSKNENPKPETPNLNQPTLRGVNIYPKNNDYNYDVDDTIMINSSLVGEHLNNQSITYQWYIQKEGYSVFEPLVNNSSSLTLRATTDLNNATFKVEASLGTKVCSSNFVTIRVNDNTSPTPPPVVPNEPIIRNVTISTNKTTYNENENISITSNVIGENLEGASISYQWYVQKNSSSFEILQGQTSKNLNITATSAYNNATFKLNVTVNRNSLDSNTISITVNSSPTPIPPEPPRPEPPVEDVDFSIITSSNKVNIGSGITFNAIFKNGINESKINWYIQKNSGSWEKMESAVNDTLSFVISDNSFDNAKIKATTTINSKEVNSNEITIFISDQYVPPSGPSYETPEELTPPNITPGSIQTRDFPYDVKETLVNYIKINGKPVDVEKVKVYGDTFTVFFEEKKDFNVEIELNTNYHDYGINMGFENPRVSFYKTTYNSGMEVVNDGNFNKIVSMQPLSIKQPTHFVQITGKIQEQGYQAKDFNINIKFRNTFINNMVEGEDYIVVGNDFIVNPYTQNEAIINKYGNAPLPIVKNGQFVDPKADVSKEDLFKMFHIIVSQKWRPLMNFGSRKIWSEFFVDTFIEWLIKNWKYYPDLNFNNSKLYFTTNYPNWFFNQYRLNNINQDPIDGVDLTFYGYDTMVKNEYNTEYNEARDVLKISKFLKQHYDAKDIYMTEIKNINLAERMSYSSEDQDKFLEGVGMFFANYVRPGMSDKDKVFAVNMFVSDWLAYNGKSSQDPYGFWSNHNGVCANYGGIAAYLLNILGVPAIPVVTGDVADNPVNMLHMNTWIYLDADGDGTKKWYMQDATNIDESATSSTWPGSRFMGKANKNGFDFKLLLTDVYDRQYGDYDWDEQTQAKLEYIVYHNNFFNYFGAQWFRPYLQNEVSFGSYNIKKESWMVSEYDKNKPLSKPAFYNGDWYFFDTQKRFVKTKITGSYENAEDLTKNIPPDLLTKIQGDKYGSINMAQYGKYVFISNFSQYDYGPSVFQKDEDKWFIIHDLTDTNWKKSKLLSLDNKQQIKFSGDSIPLSKTGFTTYFFDQNGNLYMELVGPGSGNDHRDVKLHKINIFEQWSTELSGLDIGKLSTKSEFDSQGQMTKEGDDNIAYKYFTIIGNAIGILPGIDTNVTPQQRQDYNDGLTKILKNDSLSANEKAIKMKQLYDGLLTSSYKTDINNTLIRRLSQDLYELERQYFDKLGVLFDLSDGFESFDALALEKSTSTTRYDIYYSTTKDGTYEPLAEGLYEPRIIKDYFKGGKEPSGYYYVEYYTLRDPSIKKRSQIIKVDVQKSMWNTLPVVPDFEIWKYSPEEGTYWKHNSTTSNYNKFNPQWSHVPYEFRLKWNNVALPSTYKQLNVTFNHIKKDGSVEKQLIQTITSQYQNINFTKNLGLMNDQNAGAYFIDFEYITNDGTKYNLYSRIYYMLEYNDIVNKNFDAYKTVSNKIIEITNNK